jgi:iron(III) transport system permease protein
MKATTVMFGILAAFLAFLAVVPLYYLICVSFSKVAGACTTRFTIENYIVGFTNPKFAGTYYNTVVFAVGSAALGTIVAIFVAWVVTRTNPSFVFSEGQTVILQMDADSCAAMVL